ncbi:MAG: hypothetical protein V8Q40_08410 [Anaerosacchariphilus sp.]
MLIDKLLNANGLERDDLQPQTVCTNAELEAALCELEENCTARMADIENALCDIDGGVK